MQGIADQNWQDLHELYCEQAVVEHPFASRDYHNHALMANVMGRLLVLVAALTEETAKPSYRS